MEAEGNKPGRKIGRANKHFTFLSLFNDPFCKYRQMIE